MGNRLTKKEWLLLSDIAETGEIHVSAKRLGIALSTAKNRLTAIRLKTGAVSTMQLMYWLGAGELDQYRWGNDHDENT